MIVLVLERPAEQAVPADLELVPLEVAGADLREARTLDVDEHAGEGQAALFALLGAPAGLDDLRVDAHHGRIVVGATGDLAVDEEDALESSDLNRRDSRAVLRVHRVGQVGDELPDPVVDALDVEGGLPQARVGVGNDGQDGHDADVRVACRRRQCYMLGPAP